MKKALYIFAISLLLVIVTTMAVWGNDWTWESAPGHHDKGTLLESSVKSSEDIYQRFARGEIFSEGSIGITDLENGEIYIAVHTLAHKYVDKMHHAVYLDQWDDKAEDWVQVGSWDFVRTKEEENGELSILFNTLRISGYPANKYYRARGLHQVILGDTVEGGATRTHGVLITDN